MRRAPNQVPSPTGWRKSRFGTFSSIGGSRTFSFLTLSLVNIPHRAYTSRADFVYMAPPFIAHFGALQNDSGGLAILQIAYDQIRLYRQALFDQNVSLWRHIANGSSEDTGHWAT